MKFCENCNNMLYINGKMPKDEDLNKGMELVCHFCGYNEHIQPTPPESVPVLVERYTQETDKKETDKKALLGVDFYGDVRSFKQYQTDNIVHDKTLPRVCNIQCPQKCDEQKKKFSEIICIRYDQANMKYLYYCVDCKTFWTIQK